MRFRDDGTKGLVAGCYCEWCLHKRGQHNRNDKLRKLGRPALVSPDEFEAAQRKLRRLQARGMSSMMMAAEMDVSDSTVTGIISGVRIEHAGYLVGTIRRSTYDKVMRMAYVEPDPMLGHTGSRLPPEGTQRRMRALAYLGYGYEWLGDVMDRGKAQPARMARVPQKFVTYKTYKLVKDVYEKYRYVDPEEVGVSHYNASRQRKNSARLGYAPPNCWDDDSIDDPQAIPEWTGACGTIDGVRLHYKYKILPLCPPCAKARAVERKERGHDAV